MRPGVIRRVHANRTPVVQFYDTSGNSLRITVSPDQAEYQLLGSALTVAAIVVALLVVVGCDGTFKRKVERSERGCGTFCHALWLSSGFVEAMHQTVHPFKIGDAIGVCCHKEILGVCLPGVREDVRIRQRQTCRDVHQCMSDTRCLEVETSAKNLDCVHCLLSKDHSLASQSPSPT